MKPAKVVSPPPAVGAKPPREVSVTTLLGPERCVCLRHGRERYLLRLTRQNKLLLTK